MKNVAKTDTVFLEQLVYTWAEHTLTGTGNGVVLRSSAWPTGNSTAADAALADFVEYLPAKLQHRLGSGRTPPLGADFWQHPDYGNVVAVHRYLGVDSAGRGGRSIVHVFLDREGLLDARSALELCRSPLVATEWELMAEPVNDSDALVFVPGQDVVSESPQDEVLLLPSLAGVLEYLIHGRQIVFTHDQDVDALGLLEACFNILPLVLVSSLTFSTFRGIPQRSKCAVSFASTTFSEVLPKADVQKTYLHLYASDPEYGQVQQPSQPRPVSLSAAALDIARELLRLRRDGGPACPPDISSIHALDQWLRHYRLTLRPIESLQLDECEALLALPAETSWVDRDRIIARAAKLTESDSTGSASGHSFLILLGPDEKEAFGRTLHLTAVAELVSSPGRSLAAKHRAEALGYPVQRLADLAVPVLDGLPSDERNSDPALDKFVAEIARYVPLQQRFDWVSRPGFRDPLLKEWQPTAHAIAKRTWTDPQWAIEHAAAAKAVAVRHPRSSAEFIATALAGYEVSPRGIDAVLALDETSGDEAFTAVIKNMLSLPGLDNYQLRRLAASDRIPSAIRAEISTIIEPPEEQLPASPLNQAPLHTRGTAEYPALPSAGDTAFIPNPPLLEPARQQSLTQSSWDSSSRHRRWTTASQNFSFAPSALTPAGNQSEADSTMERRPAAARRRTLVRMLAVVLSTAGGYLVAETNWSPLVWPPVLVTVFIALVLMTLPIHRPARARSASPRRFPTFRQSRKAHPLKTGSRFFWPARKPSE